MASDTEERSFSSQCSQSAANIILNTVTNKVNNGVVKSPTEVDKKVKVSEDTLKDRSKSTVEEIEDRDNMELQTMMEEMLEKEEMKEQTTDDKEFAEKLKTEMDRMTKKDREFCLHIERLKLEIDKIGCKPQGRGIHQEGAIKFYEEILGAKEKTIRLLREGYRPEYTQEPEEMHLQNNKSVLQNMEICREQVRTWERSGYVEKLKHRPRITNPLSLVSKKDLETGKMKYRTCIDPSRTLNKYLEPPPVRLQDLRLLCPR